ncbi:ATP-dependent DNA helicase RecG [Thiomicrospira sp. WB1]|uniref:ATP-dependent DNA helicase RecG n=1 Tax=Thiomicrospira sp. WB1 TaxID=1685380 RepID=UPI00074A406F|nr:ATP-dependent DNA helicase RecG [Thiomicrospira sp. WB1]KUJ72399.1 ATP-dependent DNA helicase RecG [Thiomicrospira sp. WB1]
MQLARQRLTSLKGVGEKQAEKLARLGLHVVQDLLFHLPLRYQDKTRLQPVCELVPGQETQIEGEIVSQHLTQSRNSSLLVSVIGADGGRLTLRFFHFGFRQAQQFKRGSHIRAFGEVRGGPKGLEMVHPAYRLFAPDNRPPLETTLTPVYPSTEGLGQATLLKLIKQAMALLQQYPLDEGLPKSLLSQWQLPPINQALTTLHQPQPHDDLAALKAFTHPAQARLIFEELLTHQLSMQWLRQQEQTRFAPPIGASQRVNQLLASLPFELTGAQQRVWAAIAEDLKRPHPMQRLVQGDVGSGKTIVAAMAAIQAAEAGFQVAVMAPTEILAEQHRNHFAEWLEPLKLELAWLNGRLKSAEKRHQLARIEQGDAKIVVGTHALFQKEVRFDRLGLVIIDEQHRFGVHQRLALHDKGLDGETHPHQLIMTATPIPRTLAMSAYGDLDLSVIDQLPPGRQPVDTAVLNQSKREDVMAHLVTQCEQGVQAYWVCPLIEESDQLDAQAAEVTAEQFQQHWPDLRLGLIHGRMKGEEKAQVMAAFQAHQLDLLVATTVIEVGVNVPNASLMIIENAERLGLAQLHQLRGRVGRGAKKSHCVLLYKPPLSETGKARLNIMRETNDGFVIAEEDLKLRGPGEILGTRQTGGLQFRIADLERDQAWLNQAREAAMTLLNQMPDEADCLHQRWLGEKMGYQHA